MQFLKIRLTCLRITCTLYSAYIFIQRTKLLILFTNFTDVPKLLTRGLMRYYSTGVKKKCSGKLRKHTFSYKNA
jgi:hypothetical protein